MIEERKEQNVINVINLTIKKISKKKKLNKIMFFREVENKNKLFFF